ncbi:hypothetical protein MPSEU_001027100 [Mayamaea pseudoterrestris]|nr:hypothetical protein MPSEU_001027100 [Mayamaea pseudoterrestris]
MLTPGLVSLNIHEALTFDGTEIVLHPDLFSAPGLTINETNTSTSFGSIIQQQQRVKLNIDDRNGSSINNVAATAGTAPASSVQTHHTPLLQPGDLVEIRVWDPIVRMDSQQSTNHSSHMSKQNVSSIMRRRPSHPTSTSNAGSTTSLPNMAHDVASDNNLQQHQLSSNNTRDLNMDVDGGGMSASASYMSAGTSEPSIGGVSGADDATEPTGATNRALSGSGNGGGGQFSSQSSIVDAADASSVHSDQAGSRSDELSSTPRQSPHTVRDESTVIHNRAGSTPARSSNSEDSTLKANNIFTAAAMSSDVHARVPATAPETSRALNKPPIPIRNRTTGSINPVVTDLFGSKNAISPFATNTLTPTATNTTASAGPTMTAPVATTSNNRFNASCSSSTTNRPRHFRDLSDMTMDTINDIHIVPNMTTTSEEEDDALWTQLSSSHRLRQSFCFMVSAKSLTSLKPSARTQISLLRPIADLYGLSSYDMVTVHKVDDESVWQNVSADFVLVTIKDQFISRGDMHYFISKLIGSWVYEGERLLDDTKGIQAHAKEIRHKDKHAYSGLITDQTKITFRSRSSRLIWLVQISVEMFDYASPYDVSGGEESRCETYFDKWIAFVKRLFAKWKEQETSHSLTVVFFSRTFMGTMPGDSVPLKTKSDARQPTELRDIYGRAYEDHFRLVIDNATSSTDLDSLIIKIKEAFVMYPAEVGWNSLTGKASRRPSLASQGNVLEATNVTLNLLQFHYFDRDLNRTGNSLVIISAGNGVFEVDKDLAGITYQRMMDNGIGSDMLSLSLPPLHIAPFFLYTDLSISADVNDADGGSSWEVPHWLHLSFISYDEDGLPDGTANVQNKKISNPFEVANIAGHAVAANGFILPTRPAQSDAVDTLSSKSSMLRTQERQLIAGRDFRDILDACRPRHIGGLPSPLKALLDMYNVKDDHSIESTKLNENDIAIEEWGSLKSTIDLGDDNARVYRLRAVSLGQEPAHHDTGASFGQMIESDNAEHGFSYDSQRSGGLLGVSYDRPFMAHAASPSVTGIELQRSPSFHIFVAEAGEQNSEIEVDVLGARHTSLATAKTGVIESNLSRADDCGLSQPYLEELLRDFDSKLVNSSISDSATFLPGVQRLDDKLVTRGTESRSSGKIERHAGGLELALSRYRDVPVASALDYDVQTATTSTATITSRSTGTCRQTEVASSGLSPRRQTGIASRGLSPRRQTEVASSGQSPVRLLPILDYADKSESFSPSRRLDFADGSRIYPFDRSRLSLASARSFALSYSPRSPPKSDSPTLLTTDRDPHRRASIESSETYTSERRRRQASKASRRRKAFNPFRQQDEDEVLAKKTHNRLRWTHVFPLGEIEFKRHAGPSWKSLTCPAILPLSVDYFPSQQEVDRNYTFSIYNVTRSEFETTPYSSNLDLMWEMVRQRLTQDYQLVPKDHPNVINFRRETLGRSDSDNLLSNVESPGTIRVFLSMGYSLQILTYDPALDVIEVTRYDAKNARTQTSGASSFRYIFLSFCPMTAQYLPVIQTFTKYSALYNWNKVDRIIAGDSDREMREGMRFKRIMFAVLPERCEDAEAENMYIDKFQRLVEYFEKLREKDGSSEPLKVTIVKLEEIDEDVNSRKKLTESTPGISWNAMRRFYVKLKKSKNDTLEWMEIVVDSTFKTCWSYRIMFQWLVASSGKVEAQVQMLSRR